VRAGHDIEEIARLRALTVGTICDHVEKLRAAGELVHADLAQVVPDRLRRHEEAVHDVFSKVGSEKLAPAHAQLKGKHTYDVLRILRLTYT